MTRLLLKVEPVVGAHINDVIIEAVEAARRLDIGVEVRFNAVRFWAWPHDTVASVNARYEAACKVSRA